MKVRVCGGGGGRETERQDRQTNNSGAAGLPKKKNQWEIMERDTINLQLPSAFSLRGIMGRKQKTSRGQL